MKQALYYEPLPGSKVRCLLCPHLCLLTPNKHGICLTRFNNGGQLFSSNYGQPVSMATDPIEKKPLYHFHPGSQIFSTGPNGCTFKCAFCQNHEISQKLYLSHMLTTRDLFKTIVESGTIGVAYTYSEPYIWFETIMEVGAKVREAGMVNVMVTNGYMNPRPLDDLLSVVDAMNIDIKSMRPAFYRTLCKGDLEPVLKTCETAKKRCHLEITNLVISGANDTDDDFKKLASFIAVNLGKETPLHLSRCFPRHLLNTPPTPAETLMRAWEICKSNLEHVYVGNLDSGDKSDTRCASCNATLISRWGYSLKFCPDFVRPDGTGKKARCAQCATEVGIVM